MTGRDRTVLIVIVVAAILGAAWILVVSPERQKAGQLNAKVAEAQAELTSAEGKVSSARAAQSQYATAYASLVSLGKAVPPSEEVPSLIEQLASASDQKRVDFSSITDSTAGSSAASGASTAAATAAAAGGFTELPFTFVFEGSYFDLEHLFNQLTAFANVDASGDLQINGRLLTIQSVRLSPDSTSSETHKGESELTGSVTATAYVMPATQALSGATASAGTGTSASPASSAAPASSATSPAIVRINP